MAKTAIMKSDIFLEHEAGFSHVESPDRLAAIYSGLDEFAAESCFVFPEPEMAEHVHLELIHTAEHVRRIAETAGQGFVSLDPDTGASSRSYEAARLAAGAVVQGVRMLVDREVDNVFALVRPPGHHAEASHTSGFCLFNNVAVGAAYGIKELGLARIMIVDWDLHHGNGTQHSFYDTDQVLYFSSHMHPYFPGTGLLQEVGSGQGEGFTVNLPLSGGVNDQAYASIFNELVAPIARQYKPEMIMISAGYDTYYADPLGTMAVTAPGFAYMTRVVRELAEELCGGRLLLTLEGGYSLEGLRDGVLASLGELAQTPLLPGILEKTDELTEAAFGTPGSLPAESLEVMRKAQEKYWQI